MLNHLGISGNIAKKTLAPLCREIALWASRNGATLHVESAIHSVFEDIPGGPAIVVDRFHECELLCILGGDGFLLHAARGIHPATIPLLPVNIGSLGFNTQAEPSEITEALDRFHSGEVRVTCRHLLEAQPLDTDDVEAGGIAMNDVLLMKETHSRMIHVSVHADGVLLGEVPCDGMIVSTPTGSTAYNLSAGGPIVHPTLPAMILIPVCPHTLASRAIVLPSGADLILAIKSVKDREEAVLCLDGHHSRILAPGERVRVSMASDPIMIAEPFPERYYEKLRERFRWGVAPRHA